VECESRRGGCRVLVTAASDPRVEIWDAERKSSLLERVLDASIGFRWAGAAQRRAPVRAAGRPRLALAAG
jgi:hypothetical protein